MKKEVRETIIQISIIIILAITLGVMLYFYQQQQNNLNNKPKMNMEEIKNNSMESNIETKGKYNVDGIEENVSDKEFITDTINESAIRVTNKGKLTINNCKLSKSGDSEDVNTSNFTGLNAGLLAENNSEVIAKNLNIITAAEGANSIFSTGESTKITVSDTNINTSKNSSRGLDATYGGTIIANNMKITTVGAHSAPIATDRGEGTIEVSNSTLNAEGDGSPCIYSTGNITAKNVLGVATGSQAAVIEGKNSITLENCNLTGAGQNGMMLYQSTSGDASVGTSVLNVTNSKIKSVSDGPMFYITNTDSKINIKNTNLEFGSGILVNAAGNNINNWGKVGSNGGKLEINAENQILDGNILCDNISSVLVKLNNNSKYMGMIDKDNSGDVSVKLDNSSIWNVIGDSYVTYLMDNDESLNNIKSNGHTIYYDSSNENNNWLNGKTISLDNGGILKPME